jgi:hypothetical protein
MTPRFVLVALLVAFSVTVAIAAVTTTKQISNHRAALIHHSAG